MKNTAPSHFNDFMACTLLEPNSASSLKAGIWKTTVWSRTTLRVHAADTWTGGHFLLAFIVIRNNFLFCNSYHRLQAG